MGNLLFIYAHARAWCEREGYELCMHPWIGEKVFNIPPANRTVNADIINPERLYQEQEDLIYTRKQVREWFSFKPEVLDRLKPIQSADLLFDVRHGQDIIDAGLVHLSIESYARAALNAGYDLAKSEWEIYPDNPTRLPSFTGNDSACGLGVGEVSIPAFYRLMTAKVHFRAPSTFSFWAALLGSAVIYSPVIRKIRGGTPNQFCGEWVQGNYPAAASSHSDWHVREV